jgi:hypothetical protein
MNILRQHSMLRLQIEDRGDSLKTGTVAVNVLSEKSRTADTDRSSSLGGSVEAKQNFTKCYTEPGFGGTICQDLR